MVGSPEMTLLMHVVTVPPSLDFIRGQSKFMQEHGFEVHAVSSSGEKLEEFKQSQGVETHTIEMYRMITPVHDMRAIVQLTMLMRRLQPTIVHGHTPKGGLVGMVSAWIARVPVRIYHIRGLPYMTATCRKRTLLKATEFISCKLAHRVFCVSESVRSVAIRDRICPAEKICVIGGGSGNGVDAITRFSPLKWTDEDRRNIRLQMGVADGDLVIGFVGRVVRDKGIHELATAWWSIRDSHPNTRLIIVGPFEPQDPIEPSILSALQDDSRVHITGPVSDIDRVYSAFDLVVLPTYREGFPNVPLEASAMELPVVATRIPGCVDAVQDGVTGTLVPVRDAELLGRAIVSYLDDTAKRRRHGKAGRERVLREFRQEDIWTAIYQEYICMLREKGEPVPLGRRRVTQV